MSLHQKVAFEKAGFWLSVDNSDDPFVQKQQEDIEEEDPRKD